MDDSLNTTFCVEEETSFLSNHGTPLNFKKLLDRPATVAAVKFDHNKASFISPLPLDRGFQRNKFNAISPIFMSPIEHGVSKGTQICKSSIYYDFKSNLLKKVSNNADRIIMNSERKYNKCDITKNVNTFLSPVKVNLPTASKIYGPCEDSDVHILKSSVRREREERNSRKLKGEVSPITRQKYYDIVRYDARQLELSNKNFDVNNLNYQSRLPYVCNSPINDCDQLPKSQWNKEEIEPINIPPLKRNEFVMKCFSPIRDSDGNIMMSSVKKKIEEEKKMKESGVMTPARRQYFMDIVRADTRKLELEMKIKNDKKINLNSPIIMSPVDHGNCNDIQISKAQKYYNAGQNLYNCKSNKNMNSVLSPINVNLPITVNISSQFKNCDSNILMGSAKRQKEESDQRKLKDEVSPNTRQKYYDIDRYDGRQVELSNNLNEQSCLPNICKSQLNVFESNELNSQLPQYPWIKHENETIGVCIEKRKEFVMKTFSPIRDSDGNIMMSSVKKKMEEERKMKESGVLTTDKRQYFLDKVRADTRKLELEMMLKKEIEKETMSITSNCVPMASPSTELKVLNLNNVEPSTAKASSITLSEEVKRNTEANYGYSQLSKDSAMNKENIPTLKEQIESREGKRKDLINSRTIVTKQIESAATSVEPPSIFLRPATEARVARKMKAPQSMVSSIRWK